jgi:hypothetical protein
VTARLLARYIKSQGKKVNEKLALDGKYNAEWFNLTINNELKS